MGIEGNINDVVVQARHILTMWVFLPRTIQDLDDLEPSTWVQQTEVSSQRLDQLKGFFFEYIYTP